MVGEPVEPRFVGTAEPRLVSVSNHGLWARRTTVGEPVEPWLDDGTAPESSSG